MKFITTIVSLVAALLAGCAAPSYYFEGVLRTKVQNADLLPNGRLALVVDGVLRRKGFKAVDGAYTDADIRSKNGRQTWYSGPNETMVCIFVDQRKVYLVQRNSTSRNYLAELALELERSLHQIIPCIVVEWSEGTFDRPTKGLGA